MGAGETGDRYPYQPDELSAGDCRARVLAEKPFDEMVRSGFPARLHVRAELWSEGRWFDDVNGRAEWDIIVRYDVIDRSYEVVRRVAGAITSLGSYTRFADARAAMELAFAPHCRPRRVAKELRARAGRVAIAAGE